jgi:hypothetical protein
MDREKERQHVALVRAKIVLAYADDMLSVSASRWSAGGAVVHASREIAARLPREDRKYWYSAAMDALRALARAAGADAADDQTAFKVVNEYSETHPQCAVLKLFEQVRCDIYARLDQLEQEMAMFA